MILFDVTLETNENERPQLMKLLRETMRGSSLEAGCLLYRFTADLDDPQRFHLVELWESEAALTAHARGEAFRNFLAALPSCGRLVSSVARSGDLVPYTFKRPQ